MDYKKQQIDLNYGIKSEANAHQILEEHFGKLLRSSKNPEMGKFYPFDKYNHLHNLSTTNISHQL